MSYQEKKSRFEGMLTLYGRQSVKEALQHPDTQPFRLHLATSNRTGGIVSEIKDLAASQGAEIFYHSRKELSRISKNSRQDQGVAVDIQCKGYGDYLSFKVPEGPFELLAVDRVTNPVNLGMIIRTVAASPIKAIIVPRKGSAKLDGLVVKSSAGYLFKANILVCEELKACLEYFKSVHGCVITGLSADAKKSLSDIPSKEISRVFILGNESEGVGQAALSICDELISIPMENQVESLNVAVTAGLVAFRSAFAKS